MDSEKESRGDWIIRKGRPDDAETLSDIALRSKAIHGYSDAFMEACREELTVPSSQLEDPRYHYLVAESNEGLVGYAAVERLEDGSGDLDALFVAPAHVGKGVGRSLMEAVTSWSANEQITTLHIQSDPGAEAFYQAFGAIRVGETASGSIPGRFLPQLKLDLDDH